MTDRPNDPGRTESAIFLKNLAALRKQHNLPQLQMAKILGIGIASWCMIERGIMPPKLSAAVVYRAADAFGIPAARLFSEMTIN